MEVAAALRELGVFIPAVRFPTVPRGQARLRLTLTATHTHEDVVELASALASLQAECPAQVSAQGRS